MKQTLIILILALIPAAHLHATRYDAQTIGGGTGIIITQSAKISSPDANGGINIAHHTIFDHNHIYHIPKLLFSLGGAFEAGAAYDYQNARSNSDLLANAKYKLYGGKTTSIATGGNFQYLRLNNTVSKAGQAYTTVTYSGDFFSMPAETTMLLGKSFIKKTVGTDFDFSMGFDVDMLPNLFHGRIHWITDFSNYGYSVHAGGMLPEGRGVFNTGTRFILANSGAIQFSLDLLFLDFLDEKTKSLALGAHCRASF